MSLFEVLRSGLPYLKLKKSYKDVKIEELTFRLQSRTTTMIIIALSTLVCATEYFGQNIKCLAVIKENTGDEVISTKFMETYCYIQTTFTVPYNAEGKHFDTVKEAVGSLPGGWPYVEGKTPKVYHAYYQWVPFYLLFLALLFSFPHSIWKTVENNKIQNLIQDLNAKNLLLLWENQSKQIKLLAKFIWNSRGHHTWWACIYIFCEILNLGIVIASMFLTDLFLNGEFAQYGIKAIQFIQEDPETRVDPMSFVFPRLTKCQFRRYGSSGDIQSFDTICVLTANILNEKIFIFLWVWFIILAILSLVTLLYRVAILVFFRFRISGLGIPLFTKNSQLISVIHQFDRFDWILLRLLRINLDDDTFSKLISAIYEEIINMRVMNRNSFEMEEDNTSTFL